jgi:ERCC4-type nuclease
MIIIIDTREQKPISFPGHEKVHRKLDEGDYNTPELEDKIVIERKSVEDFYGSVIQGHARFKKEILRAKDKKKKFYIFVEGSIIDIIEYAKARKMKDGVMGKIINTMTARYDLKIIECHTRVLMSSKIIETIEKELKEM